MSRSRDDRFDFRKRVAYDSDAKRAFHTHARRQLRRLAAVLGFTPGDYDLRANQGGIAVSGEITLHSEHLYVQACQPATGHDTGIMFRTCEGRTDYTGGRNQSASLDLLHTPDLLARRIRAELGDVAVKPRAKLGVAGAPRARGRPGRV
jgi:hypothetical protein